MFSFGIPYSKWIDDKEVKYVILVCYIIDSFKSKMHQEKCAFTWHSYSDHLRDLLKEMSSNDSFSDVTLVTDDKKQIKAHRNILSACSSVFKEILQINTNNSHSVIYLRGVQHSEMASILQFIYLGEAKFYEERKNEFLQVSKDLEIKELSTGIELKDQMDSNEESNEHDNNVPFENTAQTFNEDGATVEYQNQTETKPIIKNVAVKYTCNQCDKQYTEQKYLTRHIQSVHEGIKYACNQCDKQFTAQCSLTMHIQSIHKVCL